MRHKPLTSLLILLLSCAVLLLSELGAYGHGLTHLPQASLHADPHGGGHAQPGAHASDEIDCAICLAFAKLVWLALLPLAGLLLALPGRFFSVLRELRAGLSCRHEPWQARAPPCHFPSFA